MKRIVLFLTLFLLSSLLSIQAQGAYGEFNIWQDQSQSDSVRAEALKIYIKKNHFRPSKADSLVFWGNQLYEFSKSKGNKTMMADALHFRALGHRFKKEYKLSLNDFLEQVNIHKELGDQHAVANDMYSIGNLYGVQRDYPKVLSYYRKCLEIRKKLGDKNGIATTLNHIGLEYKKRGDFVRALTHYEKALIIAEEERILHKIAQVSNSIGTIYAYQLDFDKAVEYFERSLQISQDSLKGQRSSIYLSNLGNAYTELGQLEDGLDYYQKSLKMREAVYDHMVLNKRDTRKIQLDIAKNLNNIGRIYKEQGQLDKAFDYYNKSLKIKSEINDNNGIVYSLTEIGALYKEQGQYAKAIENCKKAENLAKKLGNLFTQEIACGCLYETYKALGNDNLALTCHENMSRLQDSMQSEETVKKLQQMEFTKQMFADSLIQGEQDLKVEMAHQVEVQKKDNNKNLAIGSGAFFLLLASGFFSRWRYVRKSKVIIEYEKDRSENLLRNILPAEIAEELKDKGKAEARSFESVSILFTDFKNFTKTSANMSATELIKEVNHCFEAFDHICDKYSIEKIKTIGDSYMAAGGLPTLSDESTRNTVLAALEMQSFIERRAEEKQARDEIPFKMRAGIHTGPVVAGIVGVKKFQYDIWGDSVNTASRMESNGRVSEVNISQDTYELVKADPIFEFESRGKVHAKGKGDVEMFFVNIRSTS